MYKLLPAFIVFLASCTHAPRPSQQLISLKEVPLKSETHDVAYEEFFMSAPSFSVDQYHSGLKDLFKDKKTSLLCQPAALATALIQDRKINPQAKLLKLQSLSTGDIIDANEVVRELVACTKTTPESGTKTSDTANCLVKLYREADLDFEVKLIANWKKSGVQNISSEVNVNLRDPKTSDIIKYLRDGYHILGIIDFFRPDQKGEWSILNGHIVNINGYARQKNWPKRLLHLYVTDPDFEYSHSAYPRYHPVVLSESAKASGLFLEGSNFIGLYSRAFLTGLLVFKIK